MPNYDYDVKIEAATEEEADTKMKAVLVLIKKLKANEIAKLAYVLEHEPIKTAMARQALGF